MPAPFVDFSLTLRAANARQPPACIRMFNPHLARDCGTPGGSSRRSSRTPRRELPREYRELRDSAQRGSGRRTGDRGNGTRLPGRTEAGGMRLEYAPRAGSEVRGWQKYSPHGNGHARSGEDAV